MMDSEDAIDSDGDPGSFVRCKSCGYDYPLDEAYFYFDGSKPTQPCKDCIREKEQKQAERQLIKAKQFAENALGVSVVDKIVEGQLAITPGMEHLVDALMEAFNGERNLAALVYQEFFSAKAGGHVRLGYIDKIFRLIKAADQARDARRSKESEMVSDEDIRAYLQKLMGEKAIACPDPK